jgi:hypothetical protein
VPGYPRELEAIVLTALANDPNARFQTGQEMIEALDAFAVRAKLTGSNTAMGRFMVQLFGSKKEPWVEGANNPDPTQISDVHGGPEAEPDHDNDEKTTLIESNQQQQLQRAMTATAPGVSDAQSLGAADWRQQPTTRGQATAPMPMGGAMPMGNYNGAGPMQAYPPMAPPPRVETEPGSRPLVDEKMGWQTGVNSLNHLHNTPLPDGGATRLPTQYQGGPAKLTGNRSWIILAVLMVLGLVAGILIAMQSH